MYTLVTALTSKITGSWMDLPTFCFFSFRAFAEFVLLCKTGSVLRPVHPSSLQHTSATTTALAHRHAHALTNKLQILAILKPLNPTNRMSLYQYSKHRNHTILLTRVKLSNCVQGAFPLPFPFGPP